MTATYAKILYPLYQRYKTKKNKDLLLVLRYADPVTNEATGMLFVDLDSQSDLRIDFDLWEKGLKDGDVWRVSVKS